MATTTTIIIIMTTTTYFYPVRLKPASLQFTHTVLAELPCVHWTLGVPLQQGMRITGEKSNGKRNSHKVHHVGVVLLSATGRLIFRGCQDTYCLVTQLEDWFSPATHFRFPLFAMCIGTATLLIDSKCISTEYSM